METKGHRKAFWAFGGIGILAMVIGACGGGEATATTSAVPTLAATSAPTATVAPTATPRPTATRAPATATPSSNQPRYGGTLAYAQSIDIAEMDLQLRRGPTATFVLPMMSWLALLTDAGLKPDLAESWDFTPDGKSITYHLVKNAKWHDGKPVTADDIVFNLDRLAFSNDLAKGDWRANFALADKVERVDDSTVRFSAKQASASFLSRISLYQIVMYPKHGSISGFNKKTPDAVIGSGPYKFKEYQTGTKMSIGRNTDYWRKDPAGNQLPYLDGVDFMIIPDANTQYSAFRVGQVGLTDATVGPFRGKETQVTKDVPGVQTQFFHALFTYFAFNVNVKPWDDARVRRAIGLALDRPKFNKLFTNDLGTPFRGFSTPGTQFAFPEAEIRTWPGYSPETKKQDVEQAKKLLREAGLDPAAMKAGMDVIDTSAEEAIVFQQLLKESLGIDFTPQKFDRNSAVQRWLARNFEVHVGYNRGQFADPAGEVEPFLRCGLQFQWTSFCDQSVETQLNEIDSTFDQAKRIQLSRALEKYMLLEKSPWIVMTSSPTLFAWQKWVENFRGLDSNSYGLASKLDTIWLGPKG